MAEKMMGVRFTLPGGQVDVGMTESRAREVLRGWLAGDLKLRGTVRLGEENCPGPWAVDVDKISAVQLFPVQAAQQPAQGYQPPPGIRQG